MRFGTTPSGGGIAQIIKFLDGRLDVFRQGTFLYFSVMMLTIDQLVIDKRDH